MRARDVHVRVDRDPLASRGGGGCAINVCYSPSACCPRDHILGFPLHAGRWNSNAGVGEET
eukprot:1721864-Prorocentrum_lima.AAC.1